MLMFGTKQIGEKISADVLTKVRRKFFTRMNTKQIVIENDNPNTIYLLIR